MNDTSKDISAKLALLWPWLVDETGIRKWELAPGDHEQSLVWLGREDDQITHVVKAHHHFIAAAREREAYRYFGQQLGSGLVELISVCPRDPNALLLAAAPGQAVSMMTPEIMQAAGQWLRRVHDLPYADADPIPLPEALLRRLEGWVGEQKDGADTGLVDRLRGALTACPEHSRVYCHRDFNERNWFFDVEYKGLVVIDFGQTRPDLFLYDLVALVPHWDDLKLKEAFFTGYGYVLTPREESTLLGLVGLHAMGSIAWAQSHGVERPAVEGRRLLSWVSSRL